MRIELAYGREGLEVDLPAEAEATVIRKPPLVIPPDPDGVVAAALDAPIGSPPLAEIAEGAQSACILICDFTRPVPNGLFLRPLAERLMAAGVPREGITVLVATGLHRPNEGEELAALVGDPWVLENLRVENHFARDDAMHVMLGQTPGRGVPIGIDRRFVEADVKIATGLVEPHFMAGYSGGRKVIAPGVAHHTTIRTFHSARFMEDPLAASCNLAGNPLHEEQLAIAEMIQARDPARPILALSTVIDEHRNLAYVSFGAIVESHQAAIDFVRSNVEIPVGRKFKTVLTTAAGYPLDETYYQTIKGMVTPLDILEPGGTLIIASRCAEGIGTEEFRAAQARLVALGPDAFLDAISEKSLADIDEWQTEMQLKPMRLGGIELYTEGLDDDDFAVTGVERAADLAGAVAASIARHGDADIAVIPEGSYLVPFARAV